MSLVEIQWYESARHPQAPLKSRTHTQNHESRLKLHIRGTKNRACTNSRPEHILPKENDNNNNTVQSADGNLF